MVPSSESARPPQRSRGPSSSHAAVVPWVGLLQIVIGTALLVLFGVMLQRSQDQARQLERLELRLRNLENMRSLERTSALETQLRKVVAWLQVVEGGNRHVIDRLEALQALVEDQDQVRRNSAPLLPPTAPPPPPRSSARRGQILAPGSETQPPGVLRAMPNTIP